DRQPAARRLPQSRGHVRLLDRHRPSPAGGAGRHPRRPAAAPGRPARPDEPEARVTRAVRVGLGALLGAAAVAVVLVLPHWLSDARAAEFARAGCFFIAIVGLSILIGYTGQISLGHGALMA